ncbi:MAG: exo-beta-N-acetylmuramidase NamZ domain-containing protein, partial [Bryobacteraceae bacterium]
ALLYPGLAMIEASPNYSVGRGTGAPFEQIGADWIDGRQLAEFLNQRFIPGVRVYATRFEPTASNFKGKWIEGVRFVITDRNSFDSIRLGLEVINALDSLYPGKIDLERCRWLIGSHEVIGELQSHTDPRLIQQKLEDKMGAFLRVRQQYLLYPH